MRSVLDENITYPIHEDIRLGDKAPDGGQLRPYIVWFDEPVPMIEAAIQVARTAELFAVIGTSLVVYPAAGLVNYVPYGVPKFIVDKQIPSSPSLYNVTAIEAPASEGVQLLKNKLAAYL